MICDVTPQGFRSMRLEMGHTQAQIALWFGVSPLCVLRWENKKNALPGAAKVLMHLLYEEHRGNANALRDYVRGILGPQPADAILRNSSTSAKSGGRNALRSEVGTKDRYEG